MRVTRFSDIGLRILIYLSKAEPGRTPATAAEIASQFGIPLNHLVKVAGKLAHAGWVHALRGRNGGLSLAADPRKLRVGTVLRFLEGDEELVDCAGQQCRLSNDCVLRSALAAGLRAFYDAMDRYTVADLTRGATGEQVVTMHREFLGTVRMHSRGAAGTS